MARQKQRKPRMLYVPGAHIFRHRLIDLLGHAGMSQKLSEETPIDALPVPADVRDLYPELGEIIWHVDLTSKRYDQIVGRLRKMEIPFAPELAMNYGSVGL